MLNDDTDDVLVVRERVDRRGVIAAEVSDFPGTRDGVAIEERRIGNHIVDILNPAHAKCLDEGREYRVAIERPPPAQRWIARAAYHDVVAVEPQLGRETMIEAVAVDRSGCRKEFAIGRRHQ